MEARKRAGKKMPELRTELLAGLTTFFTVSYILLINPRILGVAGLPEGEVFVATALSAAIASLIMGLYANRPFALAAGMGLNAYFAYAVILGMGISWQAALAAVSISGLLIFLLTLTRIDLGRGIPPSFKFALIAGLGLFLVFIGLQNAHLVVPDPATIISLGDFTSPNTLIAILGFFVTGFLIARGVKAHLLLGIFITALVGMLLGLTPWPAEIFSMPPAGFPLAMQLDFSDIFSIGMLSVIWGFFIITLFDVIGTLDALSIKAGFVDKKGRILGMKKALRANSFGIIVGSALGVPTIVAFLESATGIEAGGRTGIVAFVVSGMFLLSLFFLPLIQSIPIEAAAPAIVITGVLMLSAIERINYKDITDSLPALLTLVIIPFTFSIAHGIAIGSVFYVFLKLVSGKARDVSAAMYLIALLSIIDLAGFF
ncbi:MAG: NCS2 family permease [Candidatus Micrarchaeota archaeon]